MTNLKIQTAAFLIESAHKTANTINKKVVNISFSSMVAFVYDKRLAVSELLTLALIPTLDRPEIADYTRVELHLLPALGAGVDERCIAFLTSA